MLPLMFSTPGYLVSTKVGQLVAGVLCSVLFLSPQQLEYVTHRPVLVLMIAYAVASTLKPHSAHQEFKTNQQEVLTEQWNLNLTYESTTEWFTNLVWLNSQSNIGFSLLCL